jgi:hypothetical protein
MTDYEKMLWQSRAMRLGLVAIVLIIGWLW